LIIIESPVRWRGRGLSKAAGSQEGKPPAAYRLERGPTLAFCPAFSKEVKNAGLIKAFVL
jgi:hypothetical protein